MAQIVRPKNGGLGPGFWPVTFFMAALSLFCSYFIVVTPLTKFLPLAASPGDQIDLLFKFCSVFGTIIFVYVTGYVVYFAIAFRYRPEMGPDAIGVQVHDNPRLEFWWTVVPTVLMIILAIFSVIIWKGLQDTQGDVVTFEAIGYQFGFEFRYPELKEPVTNDLHVPLNTPVTVNVTSRDVLHGFWVPEVRLKADMVPGLINTIRFTPTAAGQYRIICTEYCGVKHGAMVARFFVDTPEQYQAFIDTQRAEQAKASAAQGGSAAPPGVSLASGKIDAGRTLFGQKCSSCHSVGPYEQKIVGPGLGHLFDDPKHPNLVNGKPVSPAAIAGILKYGYNGAEGVMPNATANAISNEDIANLDAYVSSLSKKP